MFGLEIGALHKPVAPKSEGWRVLSVDHASIEDLLREYPADSNVDLAKLQPVDVVWRGGKLSAALSQSGKFERGTKIDFVVASHVLEHFPDLLGSLRDFETFMSDDGLLCLALPDSRLCFDFFMPPSMTPDVLDAYFQKRETHTPASFFRMAAYNVEGIVNRAFPGELVSAKNLRLCSTLEHAFDRYSDELKTNERSYADNHTWYFTPASFQLIFLELYRLKLSNFIVRAIEPGPDGEFLVTLQRKLGPLTEKEEADMSDVRRLELLREMTFDLARRVEMQFKS